MNTFLVDIGKRWVSLNFTPPFLRALFIGVVSCAGFSASAQSLQFEYDLKITADPAKRSAYLKQTGEAPSPYE